MSFDLVVWEKPKCTTNEEAEKVFEALVEGDDSVVESSENILNFLRDLTVEYPEINNCTDDELEDCPWSVDFDKSEGHVLICCVWSRAEEMLEKISFLARKHKVQCFNPQEGQLIN